eukprot:TRINITY_DN9512_c0_g1_i1.p1 TRINITY_DN9512_c0_g1~~TRINITY_DN9512_c0_g1_i1.p1  ORF type:complete len:267 (+),score=50.10 TRINITY_DN9512_c0_g1_i1:426-1226(+)
MDEKKSLNFVTWTEEEDNILRENHRIYGERWSIIASYLKNKTSRQCKRRFSAYLSADSKKGSWSAEEDKLLIEAHEKFGNRWTKIAKIVSGRTDNAVKNRYHALINKHSKDKENNRPCILSEGNKNAFPDDKESQTVSRDSDCKRARLTPAEQIVETAQSEENQSTLNPRKVLGALPQNNLNEARLMSSNHYSTLYNPFISAIESSSPGLFNQTERSQSCLPKSPFQEYGSPVHLYPVFQDAAGEVLSPRFSDSVSRNSIPILKSL